MYIHPRSTVRSYDWGSALTSGSILFSALPASPRMISLCASAMAASYFPPPSAVLTTATSTVGLGAVVASVVAILVGCGVLVTITVGATVDVWVSAGGTRV